MHIFFLCSDAKSSAIREWVCGTREQCRSWWVVRFGTTKGKMVQTKRFNLQARQIFTVVDWFIGLCFVISKATVQLQWFGFCCKSSEKEEIRKIGDYNNSGRGRGGWQQQRQQSDLRTSYPFGVRLKRRWQLGLVFRRFRLKLVVHGRYSPI